MNPVWMRQLGGVLRLELKKTAFSRRGWWIYLLAVAPVVLMLAHWLTGMGRHSPHHSIGDDNVIFAGAFLFFFLRGSIFFGCMGIFSNLFRGEMLGKTLHYYLLAPIRREVLVAGKYVAGLAVALLALEQWLLWLWPTGAGAGARGVHDGPAAKALVGCSADYASGQWHPASTGGSRGA